METPRFHDSEMVLFKNHLPLLEVDAVVFVCINHVLSETTHVMCYWGSVYNNIMSFLLANPQSVFWVGIQCRVSLASTYSHPPKSTNSCNSWLVFDVAGSISLF